MLRAAGSVPGCESEQLSPANQIGELRTYSELSKSHLFDRIRATRNFQSETCSLSAEDLSFPKPGTAVNLPLHEFPPGSPSHRYNLDWLELRKFAIVMTEKENAGRCWVIRWRFEGKSSTLANFFQVLPWRWKAEKVKEYLCSLYYNRPTTPVAERTGWMNSKVQTGLVVTEEKNRVIVGQHPFLVANLVTDFLVTYDAARDLEVLSYTEPRGTRFDIEGGKVLRNSPPVKVSFELKRETDAPKEVSSLETISVRREQNAGALKAEPAPRKK